MAKKVIIVRYATPPDHMQASAIATNAMPLKNLISMEGRRTNRRADDEDRAGVDAQNAPILVGREGVAGARREGAPDFRLREAQMRDPPQGFAQRQAQQRIKDIAGGQKGLADLTRPNRGGWVGRLEGRRPEGH
jgi:hypothetical protein